MARSARQIDWDEHDIVQVASEINRPLGSLEHLFWLLDQNRSFHFAVTALITGRASPYDWREALDLLHERHPLLSVCIDGSPGSVPRFRQRVGSSIPLRIVEEDPETHWQREVSKELATPFDPSRAPLIRAVLIQGIRTTGFILVAHHSIADGLSLAYAIRDTLSAVSGGPFATLRSLCSQEEILAATGPTRVASAGGPNDNPPAGNRATYRSLNKKRPSVQGLRLPPALTQCLRDRARREETTVHGALSAALAMAGRKVFASWRDRPVRVINPINIRSILHVGEECGVFVGASTGVFEGHVPAFWQLAREAKLALSAGQKRDAIVALFSAIEGVVGNGMEVAAAAEFAANALAHEAVLTNLGALAFDRRFGRLELEEVWGPAVTMGFEGEQTIGVATVNGSICLTHTTYTSPNGLLKAMGAVLAEACR
jgi:hypothetical protein